MTHTGKLGKLVAALEAAAELEATHPQDVGGWEVQARGIRAMLQADPALADATPHLVWHYLADADIRRRDPAYRAAQLQELLGLIRPQGD